jgi:hypothetical protein
MSHRFFEGEAFWSAAACCRFSKLPVSSPQLSCNKNRELETIQSGSEQPHIS